jgi:hypothetical protein
MAVGRFGANVTRLLRYACICVLCFYLCIGLGCGGGSGSQSGSVPQNPTPVLSGVTPNSATYGTTALTVTVSGSGFVPVSVMEWNSAALTTMCRALR